MFSALTRWMMPASSCVHSRWEIRRGDDVEGDQALGRLLLAIDGEGDADAAEQEIGLRPAGGQKRRGRLLEP